MTWLDRLRAIFDAPRFCPVDGEHIVVHDLGAYDSRTGKRIERWVWHCPEVVVTNGEYIDFRQAGISLHCHGVGRPRWHRLATEDQEDREELERSIEHYRTTPSTAFVGLDDEDQP